jgi:hypothetical protein
VPVLTLRVVWGRTARIYSSHAGAQGSASARAADTADRRDVRAGEPAAYSDGQVAKRNVGVSGGRSLTRPFRDARRFPSPQDCSPYGWPRSTRTFGICPSFKHHFLSRRAKPYRYDSQLFHRCAAVDSSQPAARAQLELLANGADISQKSANQAHSLDTLTSASSHRMGLRELCLL